MDRIASPISWQCWLRRWTSSGRPLAALSCAWHLQPAPGTGSGRELVARHQQMQRATGTLLALAARHGVLTDLQQALTDQKQAGLEKKWGSGLEGAPPQQLTCANVGPASNHICTGPANYVCGRCHLVAYCSAACQRQHVHIHKIDCKSRLADESWVPGWASEGRPPTYLRGRPGWVLPTYSAVPAKFSTQQRPASGPVLSHLGPRTATLRLGPCTAAVCCLFLDVTRVMRQAGILITVMPTHPLSPHPLFFLQNIFSRAPAVQRPAPPVPVGQHPRLQPGACPRQSQPASPAQPPSGPPLLCRQWGPAQRGGHSECPQPRPSGAPLSLGPSQPSSHGAPASAPHSH